MTKRFIRMVALTTLILGGAFLAFGNCFGKFSITRKVYEFNDGLKIGDGIVARFFKTIVMWILIIVPLYGIAFLIDLIIINLIEFWTGNNIVGLNEYDKDGNYVKNFQKGDENLSLKYSEYGAKLTIDVVKGNQKENFIVFRNQPGKIFKDENGKIKEIEVSSQTIGSKTILRMAMDGKMKSSKIVETSDMKALELQMQGNAN